MDNPEKPETFVITQTIATFGFISLSKFRPAFSLNRNNLHEQFMLGWHSLIQHSPKAINYRLFKDNFTFEIIYKSKSIGDEFHYVMEFQFFYTENRIQLISRNRTQRSNILKFKQNVCSAEKKQLEKQSKINRSDIL